MKTSELLKIVSEAREALDKIATLWSNAMTQCRERSKELHPDG